MVSKGRSETTVRWEATVRWCLLAAVLTCVVSARGAIAGGRLATAQEYEIKAAYLFNLLLFVCPENAPSSNAGRMVIGVVGHDPFGDYFDTVEGQRVGSQDRELEIVRYGPYRDGLRMGTCDLLFIDASERSNLDKILAGLGRNPVLTVSDMDGFIESGGMIGLLLVRDRVRWEINRESLKHGGLRLSSQLLRNAVRILHDND